jgi:Toprim domain
MRKPIAGSIAETYLRECRGYHGPLPATLGFLPANGNYDPAMIAAFGVAAEPEPGRLAVNDDAVTGVHMTKLRPDGSGKADVEKPKIMLGSSKGQPIVVAPLNDLLGLAITEGIEDALTVHELTGLGAWAAGSAGRLPALSDVVPDYVHCVSVFVDTDVVGRKNAAELVARVKERGIYAEPLELGAAHA